MRSRYDAVMRTTVDLPVDIHQMTLALARDRGETLSQTITGLIRLALNPGSSASVTTDPKTGLPSVRLGKTITTEDVRRLDDES